MDDNILAFNFRFYILNDMHSEIQKSIDTRRSSLFEYYNLPDEAQKKADELFVRVEQFGSECEDQADFETRFATSLLNTEYINLFTEFAEFVKTPEGTMTVEEQQKETAKTVAESAVKHQIESEVRKQVLNALPDEVSDLYIHGAYKIPILGDILREMNKIHLFKKIRHKKNL